jgi:hypothetical protein
MQEQIDLVWTKVDKVAQELSSADTHFSSEADVVSELVLSQRKCTETLQVCCAVLCCATVIVPNFCALCHQYLILYFETHTHTHTGTC